MTLDDICATAWAVHSKEPFGKLNERSKEYQRKIMRAVLETHVKPMLATAYNAGLTSFSARGSVSGPKYAERTIAALIAGDGGAHDGA